MPMSAFLLDLRYAARVLRRTPGFAAIVVAVLALGIGANSAVFSVVNAVLLRPLPYRDPDRLYRLDELDPKGQPTGVSPADAQIFTHRVHAFENVAVSHWQNLTLTGPQGPQNEYGGKMSSGCFRMLGRPAALGRIFRDDEFRPGAPPVVILTHKLWKSRFAGDPRVLGTALLLNGTPHTIVGVMPEDFFYDQRFALWTPWQFTAADTENRDDRTPAAVRLRPGVSPSPGAIGPAGRAPPDRARRRAQRLEHPPGPARAAAHRSRSHQPPRVARRRSLRAPHRVPQRGQSAAGSRLRPRPRNRRAHRPGRRTPAHDPPAPHRKPAALGRRRHRRAAARRMGRTRAGNALPRPRPCTAPRSGPLGFRSPALHSGGHGDHGRRVRTRAGAAIHPFKSHRGAERRRPRQLLRRAFRTCA